METISPPQPPVDLAGPLYCQLVNTFLDLLPPPLDDSPEAMHDRNHAAIAARAQAEDVLRLLRQNADDIGLVIRLNAQYGSMVRTSLSVHGRLMRVQAVRHKREAIGTAANADAWTQHVAERSMLAVVDPYAGPLEAGWPKTAPVTASVEAPVVAAPVDAAPAACVDHMVEDNVSEDEINSQHAAFETWLSEQPWNQGASQPYLRAAVREVIAESRLANSRVARRELPAHGRESPARADSGCHIDGETVST